MRETDVFEVFVCCRRGIRSHELHLLLLLLLRKKFVSLRRMRRRPFFISFLLQQ